MSGASEFREVFERLREILSKQTGGLVCVRNEPEDYSLDTTHILKNKKPLFFGAVQKRKNYVSYHLMPVYVFPDLLADLSPVLRHRMQGKSCFNFRSVDSSLFEELARLTAAGYERYRKAGYLEPAA